MFADPGPRRRGRARRASSVSSQTASWTFRPTADSRSPGAPASVGSTTATSTSPSSQLRDRDRAVATRDLHGQALRKPPVELERRPGRRSRGRAASLAPAPRRDPSPSRARPRPRRGACRSRRTRRARRRAAAASGHPRSSTPHRSVGRVAPPLLPHGCYRQNLPEVDGGSARRCYGRSGERPALDGERRGLPPRLPVGRRARRRCRAPDREHGRAARARRGRARALPGRRLRLLRRAARVRPVVLPDRRTCRARRHRRGEHGSQRVEETGGRARGATALARTRTGRNRGHEPAPRRDRERPGRVVPVRGAGAAPAHGRRQGRPVGAAPAGRAARAPARVAVGTDALRVRAPPRGRAAALEFRCPWACSSARSARGASARPPARPRVPTRPPAAA